MEEAVVIEKPSFKEIIKRAGRILIGWKALCIYHVIAIIFLLVVAETNGNNSIFLGLILAIASLLAMFAWGCDLHRKMEKHPIVVKLFDLDKPDTTPRQYIWLATLPIAFLLVSSCTIYIQPIQNSKAYESMAVITQASTNTINVATRGRAQFFNPYSQRVEWFSFSHNIVISQTFLTKDGKKVQGYVKADLELVSSKSNVLKQVKRFGSYANYRKALENAITESITKSLSQYNLAGIPPQIVIEDLIGNNINLGSFGVQSGTITVSDFHRYFEVK
jgi:hypothetical protein